MREKEKLLVTSNFSFSHSVFKRLVQQTRKNQGLFGKGLKRAQVKTCKGISRQTIQPNLRRPHSTPNTAETNTKENSTLNAENPHTKKKNISAAGIKKTYAETAQIGAQEGKFL